MKTKTWMSVCTIPALLALILLAGCGKKEEAPVETPAASASAAAPATPIDPATVASVSGTVKLDGEAPKAAKIDMSQDPACKGTNMAENESMIFRLGPPQQAHFWMKNCFVPLSVAYIDSDGVILEIHDLQPQNTNTVDSTSQSVVFALETRQGWFQRHNIHEGVTVRTERGSLAETFGGRR